MQIADRAANAHTANARVEFQYQQPPRSRLCNYSSSRCRIIYII